MKRVFTCLLAGILFSGFVAGAVAFAQGADTFQISAPRPGPRQIQTGNCVPPPSGLVSWWPGEGNALDVAGVNNGTLVGNVTFMPGEAGQAFDLDGSTSYVSVPASPNLNVGSGQGFTLECWIAPAAVTSEEPLMEWRGSPGINNGAHFWLSVSFAGVGGPGCVYGNIVDTTGNIHVFASSPGLVQAGVFQHVALTYDESSGIGKLYYNGLLVASNSLGVFIPKTDTALLIGSRQDSETIYYQGLIDEPSVYDRALTGDEIAAIYLAGSAGKCNEAQPCVPPPAGMVAWWPGEGNGNDIIGGNNAVVPSNGVTFASAEVGQGFVFAGGSNPLVAPNSPALNVGAGQDFSIEAWIQPQDDPSNSPPDEETIVCKRYAANPYQYVGYILHLNAAGQIEVVIGDQPISVGGLIFSAGPDLRDGNFHHVALSVQRNSTTGGQLFVDGTNVVTFDPTAHMGSLSNGESFLIGMQDTAGYVTPFKGVIDELSFYQSALSSNDIAAIYLAGSAGKCRPVHQCAPPPAGIVGWWPGEGNANDVVGTNNGILSATGASYVPGEVGQAFRFDGVSGCVQLPDSSTLKPANITLEAWVWLDPNIVPGPGGESILFTKNTSSAYFEGYNLNKQTVANGDGTYTDHFSCVISRNGDQVILNSVTAVQRGVWYHVAATYDGNTLTLFVNGVAESSTVAGFALDYGDTPVFIGASGQPSPYSAFFGGIIDEASIYNRALATNEIAAIYAAGSAGKCTNEPILPFIATPPASQSVAEGGEVDLSVVAGGAGTLSYQWTFNGSSIPGATSDALTLANIHHQQAGAYAVKVSNAGGSVTSSPAVVTVIAHNILIYSYSGSEAVTTLGSEASYNVSGQLFFIPDTTNATFVGWAKINGKRQYWVDQVSDYLLINIPGSNNRSYTVLGKAGSGIDGNGQPHLWSLLHTGQNANLHIGTRTYYSFPNTFAFSGTQIYPAEQTGDMVLREEASGYTFMQNNTQAANNNGQTVADLVSTLVQSLVRQGYQPK